MAGNIVDITLSAIPSGVTAFSLQFRAGTSGAFTPYSLTNASPTDPDDLDIDLLNGLVYRLDAANNPTGNMVLASEAGEFEARWKVGLIDSMWSRSFPVAEPGVPLPAVTPPLSARRVP